MNNEYIAEANDFMAQCLTTPCLTDTVRGEIKLPEAMYDFRINFSDGGRPEYYRYGAMRELFNSAGEINAVMYQDENSVYHAKVPMIVSDGYAATACAPFGCNQQELVGGTLPQEVYARLETRAYEVQSKLCYNEFKYMRPETTRGMFRSVKDITNYALTSIQASVDYLRAFMFYSDGSAIAAEVKTVITGNTKFQSSRMRPVIWLRTGEYYAVFRPAADANKCLPAMQKNYSFIGWVEVTGTPDAADNTFLIKPSTTLVDNTLITAPTLQEGDVLVLSQHRGVNSVTNSMWTQVTAPVEGFALYESCAVEGLLSVCTYAGATSYRCINLEENPIFKPNCVSCCDEESLVDTCRPFSAQMIWNAITNQQERTRGRFGATLMIMHGRTYEAMRQATLDDTRFTKFYSGGETINIGAEAWRVKYDNIEIMVDNNLPVGVLIVTARDVFKRVIPQYDPNYPLKSAKLTFIPTGEYRTYGNSMTPDFFCVDRSGNMFFNAKAVWEYEYLNMIPSATTIFTDVCTDYYGCVDECRDICIV